LTVALSIFLRTGRRRGGHFSFTIGAAAEFPLSSNHYD